MMHSIQPPKSESHSTDTFLLAPRHTSHPDDWIEARDLLDGLLAETVRRGASYAHLRIQPDGLAQAGIKMLDELLPWAVPSRVGAELLATIQAHMDHRMYDACLGEESGIIVLRLWEQMICFAVAVQSMVDEATGKTTWYVTLAVSQSADIAPSPEADL